jgi:hypothetical protein
MQPVQFLQQPSQASVKQPSQPGHFVQSLSQVTPQIPHGTQRLLQALQFSQTVQNVAQVSQAGQEPQGYSPQSGQGSAGTSLMYLNAWLHGKVPCPVCAAGSAVVVFVQ